MALSLNKDEQKSAAITAGIVVALTILFFFIGLKLELPLPKGEIEISFGTAEKGSGEIQPEQFTTEEPAEQPSEVAQSQQTNASTANQVTSDDNIIDAPEESAPAATETEEETEDPEEKENKVDKETEMLENLYPQNASQGGQGDDEETGDVGDPNGSNTTNTQAGVWDGDNYFYAGPARGQAFIPKDRESNCNEKGKVGVIMIINRDGQVVGEPRFTSKGTTNTAPCLVEKAIKWAKQITFDADPSAPVQQKVYKLCNFDYEH